MYIYFINIVFMKKVFLFILIFLFSINLSFAKNIYEKELPSNFKKECFKYSTSFYFLDKNDWKYKIEINKPDAIAVRWNFLVPIINYKKIGKKYPYQSSIFKNILKLNDNNLKTYEEIILDKKQEIILNFNNVLKKDSFIFNFKHSAENYIPEVYISSDWKKFNLVKFSDLSDFDIKKIKIVFSPRNPKKIVKELVKIYELSFSQKKDLKLIKVEWWGKVFFYSWYNCADYINLHTIQVPFAIDKNTPQVNIELKENPDYNPNIEKDTDWDWIENLLDNCPKIYNPNQKDSNADWKGDMCSDIDKDWIIWAKDNCPNVYNPEQKDININWVWDKCEFDKDKDWIFDSMDNCINVKNTLQKDDDKDWIGNKCDNCKYYNPDQKDLDKNGIGDVCDKKLKEFLENDDDKDWIINWEDNCPKIANKDQKDSDWDWIGDVCDNCVNVQNKNQLDFNKNWVWDICEDSDWDKIKWIEDNCINVYNPDQKDSDNNWIGDACEDKDWDDIWAAKDNCPNVYNPLQKDIDKDWIWDKCDKKDNRFIESNKTLMIIIILIIIAIFAFAIYNLVKKLNWDWEINSWDFSKKKIKKKKYLNWESYTKAKKKNVEVDI